MRRGILVSLLLVVLLAVTAVADEVTANWQSIVIEDFDDGDSDWIVRGGRYLAVEDGESDYEYPFSYQIVDDLWPEAMGRPVDGAGNPTQAPGVLGVQASFTRRGYNYLEFIPVEEDAEGNQVPRGIPIPGQPIMIDLWAWGSMYSYYLEAQVRDYRGIVHTIKIGDLGYGGWQNISARFPNHIPRVARLFGHRRNMELVKLVMWTRPDEAVDGFHLYLDQIKVPTDTFETPFDGEGLADPDFVQSTWNSGQ